MGMETGHRMGNVPVRECRGREVRAKDDFYLFGDNDLEQFAPNARFLDGWERGMCQNIA